MQVDLQVREAVEIWVALRGGRGLDGREYEGILSKISDPVVSFPFARLFGALTIECEMYDEAAEKLRNLYGKKVFIVAVRDETEKHGVSLVKMSNEQFRLYHESHNPKDFSVSSEKWEFGDNAAVFEEKHRQLLKHKISLNITPVSVSDVPQFPRVGESIALLLPVLKESRETEGEK